MDWSAVIKKFLEGEEILPEHFDELKRVAKITNSDIRILSWFKYIQGIETIGWRNKYVTKKLCTILLKNEPLKFYALFCPAYIKGTGKAGFRTDDVGNTSKNGLKNLEAITTATRKLGFQCLPPEAIFFDIALEQPEKTIKMLGDLQQNINNFQKYVPQNMRFSLLSEKYPELTDIVGRKGIIIDPLPVDDKILNRIIDRGRKFYQLFGWNEEQIVERSKIIASSEATVGVVLRQDMPDAIMIYTPTMLERLQVYSGRNQREPLAAIVPKNNTATPNSKSML